MTSYSLVSTYRSARDDFRSYWLRISQLADSDAFKVLLAGNPPSDLVLLI